MIKAGQLYKEVRSPKYRKPNTKPFLITKVYFTTVFILYSDGETSRGGIDWVKEDCELITEYKTWEEAITSTNFKDFK